MTRYEDKSPPYVLISSTVLDLPAHREAAVNACSLAGVTPLMLDSLGAGATDVAERCEELLARADIYLGILGFRYGYVPEGRGRSLTQLEFEAAGAKGIPRLIFLMSDDHPVKVSDIETGPGAKKLARFKTMIQKEAIVAEFSSPGELKAKIVTALVEVLRSRAEPGEDPAALLLLPFREEYRELELFLRRELEHQGFRVVQVDQLLSGAMIANAMAEAISQAELVVADVTDANPNVMYELGYAHALRKPTILLARSESLRSLPADVASHQMLSYEQGDYEHLRQTLSRLMSEITKARKW